MDSFPPEPPVDVAKLLEETRLDNFLPHQDSSEPRTPSHGVRFSIHQPSDMGLGAPKKRFKLSHDPNNTAWSRSTTKYGHKILQSHGWMPGELLGARGASYSDQRSTASASHIRITLKDDNLGLGAKHEAALDSSKTTGLDVFQDLLGRLNGRNVTDLKKDRIHRSNLRSSAYIDQRWGNLRFVSGGLLVGAEMKDLVKGGQDALSNSQQTPSHYLDEGRLPEANEPQEVLSESAKRKRHKKQKTSGVDHGVQETSKGVNWSVVGAQSPSLKQERESHTSLKDMFDEVQMDKVQRHAEKAKRKPKRAKRDARHSSKVREQSSILPSPDLNQLPGPNIGEVAVASYPLCEAKAPTRISQRPGAGRLAVRHRYIQHKKMCMMDNKALNEIFMIKTG